ncbi:MAG: DNA-binding transcriptional regulator OxyR, partial [Arenimonas sp.]
KPPVPVFESIALLSFKHPPPSRRLGMLWRRSSGMAPILRRLAQVLRELPRDLLQGPALPAARKPRVK